MIRDANSMSKHATPMASINLVNLIREKKVDSTATNFTYLSIILAIFTP